LLVITSAFNNRRAYKLDRKIDGMQYGIPNGTFTESTAPWQRLNQNR
jgi:hypothetical protein